MLFVIGCIMHNSCFINNAAYSFTVVYCWLLGIEQTVTIVITPEILIGIVVN